MTIPQGWARDGWIADEPDCTSEDGHSWERDPVVLDMNPPIHFFDCRYCGAVKKEWGSVVAFRPLASDARGGPVP